MMKDTEIANVSLPEGWIEVTVGDVSEKIQYGYTVSNNRKNQTKLMTAGSNTFFA